MKKFGFTLAELLITLGLISVLVLLTSTTIHKVKPDNNKVKVIKAYNVLSKINYELLSDSSIYLQNNCIGLNCTDRPMNPKYENSVSGNMKYPLLILSKLDIANMPANLNQLPISFNTTDGMIWTISGQSPTYTIMIDTDSDGDDCSYSSSCEKPDQFIFEINQNGSIAGKDQKTISYLQNLFKLNN